MSKTVGGILLASGILIIILTLIDYFKIIKGNQYLINTGRKLGVGIVLGVILTSVGFGLVLHHSSKCPEGQEENPETGKCEPKCHKPVDDTTTVYKCKCENGDDVDHQCAYGYNCFKCPDGVEFPNSKCTECTDENCTGTYCSRKCNDPNLVSEDDSQYKCACDDNLNPCPKGYTCNKGAGLCVRNCKDFPLKCTCNDNNKCDSNHYECIDGNCVDIHSDDSDSDSDSDSDDESIPDDEFCLNNEHEYNFFTGENKDGECSCSCYLYDSDKGCSPFIQHLPIFKRLFKKKLKHISSIDFDDVDEMTPGGNTYNILTRYMDKRALKTASFMDRFQYFDSYVKHLISRGGSDVDDFFDRMNINTDKKFHVTKDNYTFQLCMDNEYYNICNMCRSRSSGCIDSTCKHNTKCTEEGYCDCSVDKHNNTINKTYVGKKCERRIDCNRENTESIICDGKEISWNDIHPTNNLPGCQEMNCEDGGCNLNCNNRYHSYNKADRFDVNCESYTCKCKENVLEGAIKPDCNCNFKYVPTTGAMEFGGAYSLSGEENYENPIKSGTYGYDCPNGFTKYKIADSSNNPTDNELYFCLKQITQDKINNYTPTYGAAEFGGAVDTSTECPEGFMREKIYGTSGVDQDLYICYKDIPNINNYTPSKGALEIQGAFGKNVENPTPNIEDCTSPFVETQILGTEQNDNNVFICTNKIGN